MNTSRKAAITAAAVLALAAGGAAAKVSPQKAAQLGKTLTPVGATRAGSKDGKIPPWTGGLSRYPADVKSQLPDIKYKGNLVAFLTRYYKQWGDKSLPNPYAGDQIEFTITSQNYRKYADHLPPGLIAMFRHYKNFKMNIYPTRRSAAYPKKVYAATRRNATRATLHGLNGVENAAVGFPFPIPKNGPQVMWNHMLGWHFPNSVIVHEANAIVSQNGSYYLVGNVVRVKFWYDRFGMTPKKLEQHRNMNVYLISQVVSPARLAGNVLLVWEPINLEKQHRSAWIYNPGQRRVRRAPNVRFDNTTGTHSDGLVTDDMVNMWNGSLQQYNWKLLGKKEMYIPYNNYAIAKPGTPYSKVIQAHHVNQNLVRYELHRVWVVQATLKKGYRDIYSKRVFYLDEDSWNIAVGDLYDKRGNLWRVEQAYLGTAYIVPEVGAALTTYNDLTSGRYEAAGLTSQKPQGVPEPTHLADSYFTPANLRRLGRR